MKVRIFLLAVLLTVLPRLAGRAGSAAVDAVNALGIDLLHQTASSHGNALLSPYSIQTAMAMVLAGAEGQTREEMVRVLHHVKDEDQMDESFAALQTGLNGIMQRQAADAGRLVQYGITNDTLSLTTANRVFIQQDYDFRPAYLALLRDTWHSACEPMDFRTDAADATMYINDWVAAQTHDRIKDLIPADVLGQDTRLVLVNAIYLKAPWEAPFSAQDTQPRSFSLPTGKAAQVLTMFLNSSFGYAHRDGCQEVAIPYAGRDLQFVIFLPDAPNGLAALEAGLTSEMLADCARLPGQELNLFLPKLDLEPPAISMSDAFQSLGMRSAFDVPKGSADFDRMAPRGPDKYLYISDIFHKTHLKLDESGTEAAAATAVVMNEASAVMMSPPKPIEVHVDRPFLFAIQDRTSGACLFLGHVTDPR